MTYTDTELHALGFTRQSKTMWRKGDVVYQNGKFYRNKQEIDYLKEVILYEGNEQLAERGEMRMNGMCNGMTTEQEIERYKSWLEDRNIELKEMKIRLKKFTELLKLYQYLNENANDYDLNMDEVDEVHNKIYELEEELGCIN